MRGVVFFPSTAMDDAVGTLMTSRFHIEEAGGGTEGNS